MITSSRDIPRPDSCILEFKGICSWLVFGVRVDVGLICSSSILQIDISTEYIFILEEKTYNER